ncbi:LysR substrate-binding domain-containing protein [Ensifer sp. ENS01]|uniref:LysR substrate-binding domain-containing protein n=1 Tax=unclassified Ensifer TaxID=2633371 RepID=UPI0032B2101E
MGASFACPTRALAALRVQLFLILLDLLGLEVAFDQQLIFREDLGVDLGPLLGVVAMPGALQFGGDGVMPPPSRPKVQVVLESTNRRVDVLREGIDVAIRVRFPPLEESDLVVKRFAESKQRLVASPRLLAGLSNPPAPADLGGLPSLAWNPDRQSHDWRLDGPNGATAIVRHRPRLVTEDMVALRLAALNGVGICQLPTMVVRQDLKDGTLVDVLPDWAPKAGIIHAAFPSRRGLLPSVRALLDFLGTEFAELARLDEPRT